jgi:hypothetical protein
VKTTKIRTRTPTSNIGILRITVLPTGDEVH